MIGLLWEDILTMDDNQLQRYSRQILLDDIDLDGQERLLQSHLMIIGAGGLGSTAIQILAAAGVGFLEIWDHDQVELSNLQRQPLYQTSQVGEFKVDAAAEAIAAINPDCQLKGHRVKFTEQVDISSELPDLILDCTDNFQTRCAVNALAVEHNIPLVAASAIRYEGQLMTFLNQGGPCYGCLTGQLPIQDVACRDVGILASQVILMASLQAQAALKHLLGFMPIQDGRLLMVDGKTDQFDTFQISKQSTCTVCSVDRED